MSNSKPKSKASRRKTGQQRESSRRQFLGDIAKVTGAAVLGGLTPSAAWGQGQAPAVIVRKFTEWGWPLPYEPISAKSREWLQSKGWRPLDAAWMVVWSGQEMIGDVTQTQKLLEKRGIDTNWRTTVAAGFSNEAFIPGRIQLTSTGALGVLALLSNKVPTCAFAVQSPGITHAATVPLDSPLKSLADLKGHKVLKRPAIVGTTTGSTNHFGFLAAAGYLGLKQDEDYTLRSMPPGDLATGPKGVDVYTLWEPHISYSTDVLKVTRLLESLNPYYIYSGYCYLRQEVEDNAPDVVQAATDAFIEAVLWAKANQEKAVANLASQQAYGRLGVPLITKMSQRYLFWPKPTVYYPFADPNGIWPKEESRISEWAYETGASKNRVTTEDWVKVRRTRYMEATFDKLGWNVPQQPPFLPKDFGGVGNLPYKPYAAALLNGPAPFPEPGELKRAWTFMGKTYQP